jgi:hypothetical protein
MKMVSSEMLRRVALVRTIRRDIPEDAILQSFRLPASSQWPHHLLKYLTQNITYYECAFYLEARDRVEVEALRYVVAGLRID